MFGNYLLHCNPSPHTHTHTQTLINSCFYSSSRVPYRMTHSLKPPKINFKWEDLLCKKGILHSLHQHHSLATDITAVLPQTSENRDRMKYKRSKTMHRMESTTKHSRGNKEFTSLVQYELVVPYSCYSTQGC